MLQALEGFSGRLELKDLEVALHDYVDDDSNLVGRYYMCNRQTEEIFWLTEVPAAYYTEDIGVAVVGRKHLRACRDSAICVYSH